MFLNSEVIQSALIEAISVLKNCFEDFKEPQKINVVKTRATSYWAQIRADSDYTYTLFIGRLFNGFNDESSLQKRLLDCLTHELLHTIDGCWNHGLEFKRRSKIVHKNYPNITIETSTELPEDCEDVVVYKYNIICKQCGKSYKYQRRPKIWDFINNSECPYSCTICEGTNFKGELL